MKNDYWKDYWKNLHEVNSQNLQVQVARTRDGKPIDEQTWLSTIKFVETILNLKKEDTFLDACGGNGLFASKFESSCQRVVVVDINAELLTNLTTNSPRIVTVHADLVSFLESNTERFSKILFYAGIQYFSEVEVTKIFTKFKEILEPGGVIFVGDIPNIHKRDSYLLEDNRFERYFDNLLEGKDTIGSWFTFDWLLNLSKYLKFESCELVVQPNNQIYSDFRFDALIRD